MRPKNKGWIKSYADYLQKAVTEIKYGDHLKQGHIGNTFDEKLYRLIQPTGLMYGHPIQHPGGYKVRMNNWDEREKLTFILFDSFVHNSFLIHEAELQHNVRDLVYESVKELIDYYQHTYPQTQGKVEAKKGRRKYNELLMAESLLHDRLSIRSSLNRNFWAGFFYNSLLFLDVYFFGVWLQNKTGIVTIDHLEKKQEQLRLCILKLLASASQADNSIEYQERKLYKFFVQSAALTLEAEREAMEYLDSPVELDALTFPDFDSWLLRKYLLELAILTIWSDQEVKELEKTYIKNLAAKLKFTDDELESSMLAIESFVITNWEQVHYLQSRHNFHIVKDRFTNRLSKVLIKNKKAVEKELRESKELMILLRKATKENLSEKEKEKVKAQLLDVLKTIPTFVIIALPFTFITLPVMLKLLPKSAFPSAFSEEEP